MHKRIIKTSSAVVAALVLTLVGANSSAYALSGHGVSYAPSFGSTYAGSALGSVPLSYNDGLTINGHTYNISNYVQTIPTKTLYVGSPATITVKLWEYGGTYQIQGVALFLNVSGYSPSAGDSDTWVQYSKITGVTVHDPHNMLGTTTADVKYDKAFMYVTFHMVPSKPMNTSWMIFTAWDQQLSVGTAKVINGVNFAYVPFAYH
ncbi:MAG: hypothetical protein KGI08_02260 [Thaumarchaeota archaeon]|nr:hypothetical protein [Nitrososphaerota archaeon]